MRRKICIWWEKNEEFHVIHIRIQWTTWLRQRLFLFPSLAYTSNTLCHSMGEEERQQILQIMSSRRLKNVSIKNRQFSSIEWFHRRNPIGLINQRRETHNGFSIEISINPIFLELNLINSLKDAYIANSFFNRTFHRLNSSDRHWLYSNHQDILSKCSNECHSLLSHILSR